MKMKTRIFIILGVILAIGVAFILSSCTTLDEANSDNTPYYYKYLYTLKSDNLTWDRIFADGGGGVVSFTDLDDVPVSYVGEGGKIVAVKAIEDGLEFINAPSSSGDMEKSTYDPDEDGVIAAAQLDANIIYEGDSRLTDDRDPNAHASDHTVGGADTIFPADPNADKYLMWDDSETAWAWGDGGAGGLTSPLSANLDFATYKAVAMACDNGTTMPSTPATGQWFLHTPTGRKILYQYDGSNWQPIASYGTITIYVDSAGTDGLNYGTGTTTNAFATLTYAASSVLPKVGTGNITINVGSGTFAGTSFSGFTNKITINGTLTTVKSSAAAAAGSRYASGANNGILVSSGLSANAYQNLIYRNEWDDEGIVDSNTTTNIYVIRGGADEGEYYSIYDWGTVFTGSMAINMPGNFSINRCSMANLLVYSEVGVNIIKTSGYVRFYPGAVSTISNSFLSYSGSPTIINYLGALTLSRGCKLMNTNNSGTVISNSGQITLENGTCVDGTAGVNKATYGIDAAYGTIDAVSGAVYTWIKNCDTGVYAHSGGQVYNTANVQYSGNSANETATAASYGYID